MKFFKNILAKLSGDTTSPEQELPVTPVTETATEVKEEKKSSTHNAIDRREQAVKAIVKSLKPAIGTSAEHLSRLQIWVVVPADEFDPMDYSWADDVFKSDLRLALDNSLLANVGKKSLEVTFTPIDRLPTQKVTIFVNELYYSWQQTSPKPVEQTEKEKNSTAKAWISVIQGTGSLAVSPMLLDSKNKNVFYIGRGVSTRKYGLLRVNDIVINEDETDPTLAEQNKHVSSAHADIVIHNNAFYLKAAKGGCRVMGGACTKVFRNETVYEPRDVDSLFPLVNNDQIELGKHVTLLFTTKKPN